MHDPVFDGWDNFFFMLGSASASLIGLLFVVMSFASRMSTDLEKSLQASAIYVSPIAIQFAVVLTASGDALAPRLPLTPKAVIFLALTLFGLVHAVRSCIGIKLRAVTPEPPHWSDFWMYGVVPSVVYLAFVAAACCLFVRLPWAIHAIAGCMLALLLSGIRNAWDLVTWMAPKRDSDKSS